MKKPRNQSSKDWQLLSAYLDGELSDKARRQMDERLLTDPQCRQTLALMRRTGSLLRALPVRSVPKNFTLTAQPHAEMILPSFTTMLRFASAAAAILLIAVFTLDFTRKPPAMMLDEKAAAPSPADAEMQAAKVPGTEGPMIIFWGANGRGSGAEGIGMGGGGAPSGFYGVGGGEVQPEVLPDAVPLAEAESLIEEAPAAQAAPEYESPPGAEPAAPEIEDNELSPLTDSQMDALPAPKPLTGSGPILGVGVPEERGMLFARPEPPVEKTFPLAALPFQLIELVLAGLLLITAIPAWLIRRK